LLDAIASAIPFGRAGTYHGSRRRFAVSIGKGLRRNPGVLSLLLSACAVDVYGSTCAAQENARNRTVYAMTAALPSEASHMGGGVRVTSCPVCNRNHFIYLFVANGVRIEQCDHCGLQFSNPQPSEAELAAIYRRGYFLGTGDARLEAERERLKSLTADAYLQKIERYRAMHGQTGAARILEIGSGTGAFVRRALARGHEITGIEYSKEAADTINNALQRNIILTGTLEDCVLPGGQFDVCVLSDVIEHLRAPAKALRAIHRLLIPGGVIFLSTPSITSWSSRLMRSKWMEFKPEHLFYFDVNNITDLLAKCGFDDMFPTKGQKTLSLAYIGEHFRRFPVGIWSKWLCWIIRWCPDALAHKPFSVVASGMDVLARSSPPSKSVIRSRKLSIIMPVYNEDKTFPIVMEKLLAKSLPEIDIEIIVIESGSTDGTRESVMSYQNNPRVTVVFQDRPRGKGYAVRAGLEKATGDFILIQDADLEYDVDDYDLLLEPLDTFACPFVLGSRHTSLNGWKIRQFSNNFLISVLMNLAHVVLTWLFNALYGQNVRDPFTMYKVFRRACIYDMKFECDRFDFDCELIAKLVRRGYRPMEIPINYKSRSFMEGKKVRFFRDPPTYVKAFFKYRFSKVENAM
jgi:SAM-dependent methyltransferase